MSYRIATMRKPFAPILSGLALGNASTIGLLANCSIATNTSIFNIPETSFGYIPDAGLPFALSRTGIRGLGEFLAVSGHTLRGADLQ
jgi:3-hydroxyisobutyryl-CoA hydrolase